MIRIKIKVNHFKEFVLFEIWKEGVTLKANHFFLN